MVVNGVEKKYNSMTISQLIAKLSLDVSKIVVECNGVIVNQSEYDDRILKDDDKIEIVSFVGGG